ncbi:unnamed protein product [Parnassius mnemosyne]|uniref:Odorant receptor n=1 Tax=Parnassius mnemosyne TaxID=213953 RepID=A0AAV1LWN5_9NEOP
MNVLKFSWIKLTQTEALDQPRGKLEKAFFESTYRLTYIMGLSTSERSPYYSIYSEIVKSLIALFICCELWNLYSETNNLNSIVDNINVTLIHLIGVFRYKNMVWNKSFYKKLAKSTQSPHFDISTEERNKMMAFWASKNEKYLRLLLTLGSCTLSVWYVYPLVDDLQYNLPVAIRLPFDYRNPTLYPLTYILIVVAFNYVAFCVITIDVIMQAHLIHLICQFTILANCFENILADCSPKGPQTTKYVFNNKLKRKYLKRFDNLVDQHRFILKKTLELKKILSLPMLGQLASSGMLICFAGYQVTLTVKLSIAKFLTSLLYLGYNVFELFVFCRWCDELKMQSENIGKAVYSSNWNCGLVLISGVRSRILLVTARAQKPLVLSAGGFCDVSLVTFTTLVKTSYSALTVLLRFQD